MPAGVVLNYKFRLLAFWVLLNMLILTAKAVPTCFHPLPFDSFLVSCSFGFALASRTAGLWSVAGDEEWAAGSASQD
jgi:hypothetical protein